MVKLRIVLLPDNKVSRCAIKFSKKLCNEAATFFTLDGKHVYPHITLFRAQFPNNHIEEIRMELEKLANEVKPFRVQMPEFAGDDRGFFEWRCLKSSSIKRLRNKAVKCLAKFIEASLDDSKNYRPHLTLTQFKNALEVKNAYSTLSACRTDFMANYIALCGGAERGTVTKIIAKFKLGSH